MGLGGSTSSGFGGFGSGFGAYGAAPAKVDAPPKINARKGAKRKEAACESFSVKNHANGTLTAQCGFALGLRACAQPRTNWF